MKSESKKNKLKQYPYQPDYYYDYYEPLDSMYPDIYYRVYPVVKQACEMYDLPNNPDFYPYPRRQAVERVTDYVYERVAPEYDYPEYDYPEYPYTSKQFGGRNLLRSLITILVIRELIRRRGIYYF